MHVFQITLYIQRLSNSVGSEGMSGRAAKIVDVALWYTALTGEISEVSLGCTGTPIANPQGNGQHPPVEQGDGAEREDALQNSGEDQWDEASTQMTRCAPRSWWAPCSSPSSAGVVLSFPGGRGEHSWARALREQLLLCRNSRCCLCVRMCTGMYGGTADGEKAFHTALALSVLMLRDKPVALYSCRWCEFTCVNWKCSAPFPLQHKLYWAAVHFFLWKTPQPACAVGNRFFVVC